MHNQNAAAPAQEPTAPAAAANTGAAPAAQPAAPAPQSSPTPAPTQQAQQQVQQQSAEASPAAPAPIQPDGEKKPESPAAAMEMLLGDEEGANGGDGDGDPTAQPPGDGYALTFPDGVVADAEAVAALNSVGKEFNITGDKAQALADAATAYGNRRVEAVMEAGRKGYADFCAEEARKTKEFYGAEYKARLTEAAVGLSKLLPDGVSVQSIRKDPNFQALTNVWWFAEMGRRYNKLVSEQPSITGNKEQPKANDLYSDYERK